MEPIISPWLIYAILICDSIKKTCMMTAMIFGLAFIISLICYFLTVEYGENDKNFKLAKKVKKISLIIFIPTLILSLLIPNQETATWMAISSYVTEDNINTVSENAKEAIDYIFDKIEGLTNENNETS